MTLYETGDLIFEGRSSRVHRARRQPEGDLVLVKRLRDLYPAPDAVGRLRRELEITRSAAGDGVIGAFAFVEESGSAGIVVEDFGARSLADLLGERRLSVDEVLEIGIQIASALARIHRLDIVHKDLNPSNIVLHEASGVAKLIDFGISQVLGRESVEAGPAASFEGTPLYMSPEQTGRMNRAVDLRSDLYSFGATLYELLTGRPPFPLDDRLELAHAHIAKSPEPPHLVEPGVPEVLSRIVMTLLQKWAEDRYQSALGLRHDLERCLEERRRGDGTIAPFPLRSRDVDTRLRIPQKLYGRDREVRVLEEAFEAAAAGSTRILSCRGPSGIGKTRLVREVLPSLTARRGRFVEGKFDQFNRGTPYASLIEALRTLVRQLLTEDAAQIAEHRARLEEALGPNVGVLVGVLEELAHVTGPPPELEELPPAEARNRFQLSMAAFLGAMASADHPLVLFLDDLQWADLPSIELIGRLATDPDTRYVLFVGAHRANEVGEGHPLRGALDAMRAEGAAVDTIALEPLTAADVEQLVSETIQGHPEAGSLAALCHAKTRGNAFFLHRFLETLYDEGILRCDPQDATWSWDAAAVEGHAATENVLELMSAQIDRLSEGARDAVRVAACIGDRFELSTLARVRQTSRAESFEALREALGAELIRPDGGGFWYAESIDDDTDFTYRFVHDRIRQAAHDGLDAARAAVCHSRIGRALLERGAMETDEAHVFEIVDHLDRGAASPEPRVDRDRHADLELLAARRAIRSAAFAPAHGYYGAAIARLGDDAWERRYPVALAAHVEGARAAYLSSDHEAMQRLVAAVRAHARTVLDEAEAREVEILALVAQQRFHEAVTLALDVVGALGVVVPCDPTPEEVQATVGETLGALGDPTTAVARITALESASDPHVIAAMRIMNEIMSSAYLAVPSLLPVLACKIVQTTLTSGLVKDGIYGFSILALVLTAVSMIELAEAVARVALGLLDRFEDRGPRPRNEHVLRDMVLAYVEPLREMPGHGQRVYAVGIETGDLEYACWALHTISANAFYAAVPLDEHAQQIERAIAVLGHHSQEQSLNCTFQFRQAVANLRGEAEDPARLVGPGYDEDAHEARLRALDYRGALCVLTAARMFVRFLFRDLDGTLEAAARGEAFLDGAAATYHVIYWHQLRALASLGTLEAGAGLAPESPASVAVAACLAHLEPLAAAAPGNFAHRVSLVRAELARVEGRPGDALDGYERATTHAREQGFTHEEALANELAGRFHLERGGTAPARGHLVEAVYLYRKWGASAKAEHLEAEHAELLAGLRTGAPSAPSDGTVTTTSSRGSTLRGKGRELDLTTLFKAANVISSDMERDSLLATIMDVAIENAGATRGFFISEVEGELRVDAARDANGQALLEPGAPLREAPGVATSLVTYVARTGEGLVLSDARADARTRHDANVARDRPTSVLCVPLEHKGVRSGLVYLENDRTADAFTPAHMQMQELLLGQAAVALENARLYGNLREALDRQVALTRAHHRFVPHQFLETLDRAGIEDVALGDSVHREMSILFSDMRGFTTHVEGMSSEESILFINRYLFYMEPEITRHRGFVDSYIGDAIMALFDDADDALGAARGMLAALSALNEERASERLAPIQVGLGVNTGELTLGTIGAANHIKCGVIGDSVNLASRVESLTATYGARLLTTNQTLARVRDRGAYAIRLVDRVRVMGRLDPVTLYEIFDVDPEALRDLKHQTSARWAEALERYYARDFDAALRLLSECQAALGEDRVVATFMRRCWRHLADPPPPDWTGVESIGHK